MEISNKHRIAMKGTFVYLIIGLLCGYGLACLLFSKQVFVDVNSGAVTEELRLPPFKISEIRSDRAFPLLFPSPEDSPAEWIKIEEKNFPLVFFRKNTYNKASLIIANQRTLLAVFRLQDLRASERAEISDIYFKKIHDDDFKAASSYVMELWHSAASASP